MSIQLFLNMKIKQLFKLLMEEKKYQLSRYQKKLCLINIFGAKDLQEEFRILKHDYGRLFWI